jgi:hypothetical protein
MSWEKWSYKNLLLFIGGKRPQHNMRPYMQQLMDVMGSREFGVVITTINGPAIRACQAQRTSADNTCHRNLTNGQRHGVAFNLHLPILQLIKKASASTEK